MKADNRSGRGRRIVWPNVVTVASVAVLIGAEVAGVAYAVGWALATLFGFEEIGQRIFEAVFIAIGLYIMYAFVRAAQRIEPFTAHE